MTRVIGIDPGYDRLGVAILEMVDGKETVIFSTCIETSREKDLHERLFEAGKELTVIFATYKPTLLGIETLFFNQNVSTAIGVAQARGVILYLARLAGCTVCELGPQEVKVAITGYGKSDKTAVLDMLRRLVNELPEKAHDDEYDAIAVAVTALAHHR